jgi:hypothetical protein
MNAAKQTIEWSLEQTMQYFYIASPQAIGIRDELYSVFHNLIPCDSVSVVDNQVSIQGISHFNWS